MAEIDTLNVVFDRATGKNLSGWDAVAQDIREGFITNFGTRVMREYFGSLVPQVLGRNASRETIMGLVSSIVAFLDIFEPRFKVSRAYPQSLTRLGVLQISIEGEYRPRALLGDLSSFGGRQIVIQYGNGGFEVIGQ